MRPQRGACLSRRHTGAWTTVALLWVAFALNYADRQIVFSIYPALRGTLGLSDTQLGLAGSAFVWIYAATMPLGGWLADRFPRHRLIVASVALWSAATVGTGLSGSFASFLGWRMLTGLTESLYFPAAVALVGWLHGNATRSRALGIHQSAQMAGIVIGGSYGGWMADHVGWRAGFLSIGAFGAAYALLLGLVLRDAGGRRRGTEAVEAAPLRAIWSSTFASLAFAFTFFCATTWLFYAWFTDCLQSRYGLSMTTSGFLGTAVLQASTVVGILCGAALADRLRRLVPAARFYVAATGFAVSAPLAYLTFTAPTLRSTEVFCAAFGLLAGLASGNAFACAYEVAPPGRSGLTAGVLNLAGGISGSVMMLVAGMVRRSGGLETALAWTAAGTAVGGVTVALCAARRWRGNESC